MAHKYLGVYHMQKHCIYGRTGQNRANLSVPHTGFPHIQYMVLLYIISVVDCLSLICLPMFTSQPY